MPFKTHFCLVSGQAAPNLLPLLDDAMKPEKVVLLVTEQMQQKANDLEAVIRPRGIKVERHQLVLSDDFDAMQEQLMPLVEKEPADQVALNATGGTKWMAIAAQEVFRMNGSAVFYVQVEDDKVLFLQKGQPAVQLNQRIDLKTYVQAYGYEFREPAPPAGLPENLKTLCQQLVMEAENWSGAIGQLNQLASDADRKNTLDFSIDNALNAQDPNLHALLDACKAAGVIINTRGKFWQFADDDALIFANGGWLEAHVNSLLNALKGRGVIQDRPYLNLHIQRQNGGPHNEVDVAFMARNRLHIIECKTRRMNGAAGNGAAMDAVYRLDSIAALGGLGTKSMLVSYRPLREVDRKRAKDLRIQVIEAAQLQELGSRMESWIKSH